MCEKCPEDETKLVKLRFIGGTDKIGVDRGPYNSFETGKIYTIIAKPESQPTIRFTPESKHTEKTQVQTSQDTSAVEKEFNPEQRELLSFSVDGEYVIVKPIQYLKTDWDEINVIVKSLGGRWVKGDSVSYWKIPL